MAGTLWLVGTPIGNLGDLTERARDVLARADVIACEDIRRTRGLLSHLGIAGAKLISFNDGNERRRVPELLEHLRGGREVALVSDAGMPLVSDPGYRLVSACVEEGITVDVAPGPSAALAALAVSGLATDRFAFEGFLPRKAGERRARLADLATETRTLILFESPRRVPALLAEAAEAFGERRVAVVRELTKVHQEVIRGSLSEVAERSRGEVRGEVVVVVEGAGVPEAPSDEALVAEARELLARGARKREAAAAVAKRRGVPARRVYAALIERPER
ncbi:MAG TPA: 16S rRNA (cytidine(1402)-2'-O)-methyltransferase [Actinomycetota bacterium]|nr:16S rRNA (cytidine(1402)-2'-O)-methyltransferase [Actinomycetota bacterium]